ncbi:MAG: type II toxin-antitoxin system prevent-host-death family antitoxin [Gammaproteobacteria bacterium]|nr:type II toxin-antitoxin system prevent-host-death family antitoxin [Gammaproteobacteria bacterium]
MKVVAAREADLNRCLEASQRDQILITRRGKPVALVVGVEGLDREQIELGQSDRFWRLARKWRRQKTISRAELDRRLSGR